jgi:hypothetical protein
LKAFNPLLSALSNGPDPNSECLWLWPSTMKFNHINAEMILQRAEEMQPGCRATLEASPDFVLVHFLNFLPGD